MPATKPKRPILDGVESGSIHELGLWLPPGAQQAAEETEQRALRHTGTYLTLSEYMASRGHEVEVSEPEIIELLKGLSAADCIGHIAQLSATMEFADGPYFSAAVQRVLIDDVFGIESEAGKAICELLEREEPTVVICEQQLLHLARLVVLHADPRVPDDFDSKRLYERWVICLLGVNDLLDAGLAIEDPAEQLSWELRQCGVNHHEDQLPVIGVHHEALRVQLRERWPERADKLEHAFAGHTGMTMADFFILGAAVQARFIGAAKSGNAPFLDPRTYFAKTKVSEAEWRPLFDLIARDIDGMRTALHEEEERYGPTTYGSLTFERFPLLEGVPGVYAPISMQALQRRVTGGVIHLLSEAGVAEGKGRSTYGSMFGLPFQAVVEETLRRGVAASGVEVPIAADVRYGPSRSSKRDSTDVILGYERNPVFVEVVSGPLRAGTLTRGDLEDFSADVKRLVIDKAEQLETSITDFEEGRLVVEGIDPGMATKIWPVIVTSSSFPHRDRINMAVEERLQESGFLQGERVTTLAIVSAEELFFCEGFMHQGKTLLALISGWKSSPDAAPHSFKNYLIELGEGRAPGSDHFELRFAEAAAEQSKRIFGTEHDPAELLARLRQED
jgi:hypothetical protein